MKGLQKCGPFFYWCASPRLSDEELKDSVAGILSAIRRGPVGVAGPLWSAEQGTQTSFPQGGSGKSANGMKDYADQTNVHAFYENSLILAIQLPHTSGSGSVIGAPGCQLNRHYSARTRT